MRKIVLFAIFSCVFALCAPTPLPASSSSGRSHRGTTTVDTEVDNLGQQLDLTKEQKAKIKNILQDQANTFDALQKNTTMSEDDKKAKGKEARAKTMERIRALLNPDQQQKLDDMHLKGIKKKQSLADQPAAAPAPTPAAASVTPPATVPAPQP